MKKVLIIGAGIAGISAALNLVKESDDFQPVIIEKDDTIGGLAKTIKYDDILADIGPHRFFTNNKTVFDFWTNIFQLQGEKAKDDILLNREFELFKSGSNPEIENNVFLIRKRFSRIFYNKKFFDYPLQINLSTILNLGIIETLFSGFSFIKSSIIKRKEENLEDFMINRFGKVLYQKFFKHYTRKVWGRSPRNISKKWGEQRIKGISLTKALFSKFFNKKEVSISDKYYYPKFGASQFIQEMLNEIINKGGEIHLNSEIYNINIENNKVISVKTKDKNGNINEYFADYVISSMPIANLINSISNVSENVKSVANGLIYRDYQLVSFLVKNFNLKNNTNWKTINNICPDSWIYIQDRDAIAGRIYIPKNFSPYLNKNINDTLICVEYFCNAEEKLWKMTDEEIYNLGIQDLIKIGAIKSNNDIIKPYRLKVEKAYPAYFGTYENFDVIKNYIDSIDNLICIGRNGQHKYNNMDHSTLSGIIASDIIINNKNKNIIWSVNTESKYQEIK